MHVKENYVIFIHLFDCGILLIIDLNKKKGGGVNFICETLLRKNAGNKQECVNLGHGSL